MKVYKSPQPATTEGSQQSEDAKPNTKNTAKSPRGISEVSDSVETASDAGIFSSAKDQRRADTAMNPHKGGNQEPAVSQTKLQTVQDLILAQSTRVDQRGSMFDNMKSRSPMTMPGGASAEAWLGKLGAGTGGSHLPTDLQSAAGKGSSTSFGDGAGKGWSPWTTRESANGRDSFRTRTNSNGTTTTEGLNSGWNNATGDSRELKWQSTSTPGSPNSYFESEEESTKTNPDGSVEKKTTKTQTWAIQDGELTQTLTMTTTTTTTTNPETGSSTTTTTNTTKNPDGSGGSSSTTTATDADGNTTTSSSTTTTEADGSSVTTTTDPDGNTTTTTTPAPPPPASTGSAGQPVNPDDPRTRELTEGQKIAEKLRPGIGIWGSDLSSVTGHTKRNPDDEVVNPGTEGSSGKAPIVLDDRFSRYSKEQLIGQPVTEDQNLPEELVGEGDPTLDQATNPGKE